MLAVQIHRWRMREPRGRNRVVAVLAAVSAGGCLVGGLLLQFLP